MILLLRVTTEYFLKAKAYHILTLSMFQCKSNQYDLYELLLPQNLPQATKAATDADRRKSMKNALNHFDKPPNCILPFEGCSTKVPVETI